MKGTGKLKITGIKFHAYHGVKPEEKSLGQKYEVSVELTFPFPENDCVKNTIDYRELVEFIERFFMESSFNLLEFAARMLAFRLMESYPQVKKVCIRVIKLSPPLPQHVESVEAVFELERK